MKISVRNGKYSVLRKKIVLTQEKEKVETASKGLSARLFSSSFSVSRDDTQPGKTGLLKEIKRC